MSTIRRKRKKCLACGLCLLLLFAQVLTGQPVAAEPAPATDANPPQESVQDAPPKPDDPPAEAPDAPGGEPGPADMPGDTPDEPDRGADEPDDPTDEPDIIDEGEPDDPPDEPDIIDEDEPDDAPDEPDIIDQDEPNDAPDEPDTDASEPDDAPDEPDTDEDEPDDAPDEPDTDEGEPDDTPDEPDTDEGEPDDAPDEPDIIDEGEPDDAPDEPDTDEDEPDDTPDAPDEPIVDASESEATEVPPEPDEIDDPTLEPEELPDDADVSIAPMAIVPYDDGAIVYTADELKNAVQSGAYDKIYLGYDATNGGTITMNSSGTSIRRSLTIDGRDPLTGTVMCLKDTQSGANRGLYTGIGNLSVTLKNMQFVGANPYGMVNGGTYASTHLTFDNVDYTGPCMANNAGTNSSVTFAGCSANLSGSTAVSAVATCTSVTFKGRSTLAASVSAPLITLTQNGNDVLTIDSGANVTVQSNEALVAAQSPSTANLYVHGTLKLTTTGANGSLSKSTQQIDNVTIYENARLVIDHRNASAASLRAATLRVEGDLSIHRTSSTSPAILLEANALFVCYDRSNVTLDNPGGKLVTSRGSATMSIRSAVVNRYMSGSSPSVWNNNDMSAFLISLNVSTSATTVASVTDLTGGRGVAIGAVPLSGSALNLAASTRFVIGPSALAVGDVLGGARSISGNADSGTVQIREYVYTAGGGLQGLVQSFDTTVPGGSFAYTIASGNPAIGNADRRVYLIGDTGRLISYTFTDVIPRTLPVVTIPEALPFETIAASHMDQLVGRADPDWHILIENLNPNDPSFKLFARLRAPLASPSGDVLENGLLFVQGIQFEPLGESDLLIASGTSSDVGGTRTIRWGADEGLLLYLPAFRGMPGERYSASIKWTFVDGP